MQSNRDQTWKTPIPRRLRRPERRMAQPRVGGSNGSGVAIPDHGRRFGAVLGLALVLAMTAAFTPVARAGNGNPAYTFWDTNKNVIPSGQIALDFWWIKDGDNKVTKKTGLGPINAGLNRKAQDIADDALILLSSDPDISKDWDFAVVGVPKGNPTKWVVQGTPKANRKPVMKLAKAAAVKIWVKVGYAGAIDPVFGLAQWDVTGEASNADTGSVVIGIAGTEFSTSTTDQYGAPKSIDAIKQDLLSALISYGYSSAYIDPDTGLVSIPNVELGDPLATDGADVGASFTSFDADLGGSAQVQVPDVGPVPVQTSSWGKIKSLFH